MNKAFYTTLLILSATCASYAQDGLVDTMKPKRYTHIISVQANELVKQVLGVSNSSTNPLTVNPFMLTYNMNDKKTGWGFRAGLGYSLISNAQTIGGGSTSGAEVDKLEAKGMQLRLGGEKAFTLSEKFSAGIGVDFIYKYADTTLSQNYSGGTYSTEYKVKSNLYGGGLMGWLRYSITPRVLIGTEMSAYYLSGKSKGKNDFFNGGGGGGSSSNNIDNKISEGKLNLPIVFFLSLRLGK